MPYSNKWNYIHHFKDLSRLFLGLPAYNSIDPKIIAKLNIKTAPDISVGAALKPHILELGLPFKDITPSLHKIRKSEAPLYLPINVHPNEKGYKNLSPNKLINFLKIVILKINLIYLAPNRLGST